MGVYRISLLSLIYLILLPSCATERRQLNENERYVVSTYLDWIQSPGGFEILSGILDPGELITAQELVDYSTTSTYLACDDDHWEVPMASANHHRQAITLYADHQAWKTVILPRFRYQKENWWDPCTPSAHSFGHKMKIAVSILCHENAHFIMGFGTDHDIIYDIDNQCTWAWMHYRSVYEDGCQDLQDDP